MNNIYGDQKIKIRPNLFRSLIDHKRLRNFTINYSLSLSKHKVKAGAHFSRITDKMKAE